MNKYKEYYYSIKKMPLGYKWTIRNKEREELQVSDELFDLRKEAEYDCQEHIDDYYR